MIKIYYQSDHHSEHSGVADFEPNLDSYLVLCGDIGKPFEPEYEATLKNASENFLMVFIVLGNNEYYSKEGKTITEINHQISKICNKFNNVVFLNNSSFQLTPKLRIIGTILWSEIPKNKHMDAIIRNRDCTTSKTAKVRCRNIYDYVDGKATELFPKDTDKLFHQNVKFIENEIKKAEEEKVELIVCTHYLPSMSLLQDKTIGYLFASNLDYLIKHPIIVWIAGHNHKETNTVMNDVHLLSNPKGYPENKSGFKQGKYIEIERTE
jgi:predicted phosphohydrolase